MQLEIVIENGQAFVLIGKQRVPCNLGQGYAGLADGTYELKNAAPISNGGVPAKG